MSSNRLTELRLPILRTSRGLIAAGVALLAVPTAADLFPAAFGDLKSWMRQAIMLAWVLLAIGVVTTGVLDSEQARAVADEVLGGRAAKRLSDERFSATDLLLKTLFANPPGRLGGYEFRVFVYDEDERKLLPTVEPQDVQASQGWEPGRGAVGVAYQTGEMVIARREQCHDDTFALNDEEKEKYRHLQTIGAAPIRNAKGELVGVLAASHTEDDSYLVGIEGRTYLIRMAQTCGRMMADVLRMVRD